MGADGTPTAKPVEVGLVTNTTAEIKSGLTEGQAVVTGVGHRADRNDDHDRRLRRRRRRRSRAAATSSAAAPVAAPPGTGTER